MQLEVKSHSIQGVQVLACNGRLVIGPEMDEFLRLGQAALSQSPELVVDLSQVRLLDDHGIGALTGLLQQARNRRGDVRLVLPTSGNVVNKVLKLTGLTELFRIFSNDMDAVGSYLPVFSSSVAV